MTRTDLKARPTVYNGIRMRSRLEAGFASWLDKMHITWAYEVEALSAPGIGQWLPDFVIEVAADRDDGVNVFYVDVKPKVFLDDRTHASEELVRWQRIVSACQLTGTAVAASDALFPGGAIGYDDWNDGFVRYIWQWSPNERFGTVTLESIPPPALTPWHGDWWKI